MLNINSVLGFVASGAGNAQNTRENISNLEVNHVRPSEVEGGEQNQFVAKASAVGCRT